MTKSFDENSEIRKSKALVFAKTAPSVLPITAQRLFMALLSTIDTDENNTENSFVIYGKDIAALAGLPPNVVGQQLEEISVKADTLRQYTIVIQEDDGGFLRTGLISSSKHLAGKRAIRISVDQYLLPYLKKMKEQFVISYKLEGVMKFKSEYSLPFYDVMLYYLKEENGYHYATIDDLRKIFNITDGKFAKTYALNQRVLGPAIKDINTHTNIEIKVEQHKINRVIVGYHFYITNKDEEAVIQINKENDEFISKIISPPINFNRFTLAKLIDEHGIDSVKNNYEYTIKQNPSNIARYLYWAVTNQIFEKQREIEQVQKINPEQKVVPVPRYHEEGELLFEDESYKESSEGPKLDKIEKLNPKLYDLIMKIERTRKGLNESSNT